MARIVRLHEYGDASVLKIENLDVIATTRTRAKSEALIDHGADNV
jgi:hypothetical protein